MNDFLLKMNLSTRFKILIILFVRYAFSVMLKNFSGSLKNEYLIFQH